MFPEGGQTRKHCFLVMFPEGGQTRKHCFLVMFPEGGQTRKHCFLVMFPEGGQTRKHCFLVMFPEGGHTREHCFPKMGNPGNICFLALGKTDSCQLFNLLQSDRKHWPLSHKARQVMRVMGDQEG